MIDRLYKKNTRYKLCNCNLTKTKIEIETKIHSLKTFKIQTKQHKT